MITPIFICFSCNIWNHSRPFINLLYTSLILEYIYTNVGHYIRSVRHFLFVSVTGPHILLFVSVTGPHIL